MNDDKAPNLEVLAHPLETSSHRPWWKAHRQTGVIFLIAVGCVALLAALVFGGRDNSGDAAGQGLAGALEAATFVLGVGLIGSVALIKWLNRYVEIPKVIMIILGFFALAIVVLIW